MKKTFLFSLTIILLTNDSFSQTFERYYGTNNESTSRVIPAIDGGFIIASSTFFPGAPSGLTADILIVKTDSMGFMQWSETMRSPIDDEAMWIEADSDGTYLICGNSYDNTTNKLEGFVIRMNTVGTIISQKLYKSYDTARLACLKITQDGGSVIAGETLNSGDLQMYLLKLDSAGNIEWSRAYGDGDQEYGTYVTQTADKGYVETGVGRINSFAASLCVVKTDSAGNLEWAKKYNSSPSNLSRCNVFKIFQTDDNGYLVSGSTNYNQAFESVLMMKIDSVGNIEWQKLYRSGYGETNFDALKDNGGYTICGSTVTAGGTENLLLMNFDDSGNSRWQLGYAVADSNMSAYSLLKYSNGRYVVSGLTDATPFSLPHILLIETDSIFDQSLCNMYVPALIKDTALLIASPFNTFTVDTSVISNGNYTVSSGVQEGLICTGMVSVTEKKPLQNNFNIFSDEEGNILFDLKNEEGSAFIRIYSAEGNLLQALSTEKKSDKIILFSREQILAKNIPEGVCIVVVNLGNNTYAKKVVITH